VSIGSSSVDSLTGNGVNTAFWGDTTDIYNASATEIALGGVHKVASFYGGVSTTLAGQNLTDPSDSGTKTNFSSRSLFGTAPLVTDVNQGQVGDCYFLASIQSFANKIPSRLQQMAVDLGDGTYAVQFKRNGITTYVRVDGELPTASWGAPLYASPQGTGGAIWAPIMEKAYAFFRTGAGTYSSLNSGWTGSVYNDLGVSNSTYSTSQSTSTLYNTVSSALTAGKAVTIITKGSITGGASLVGSHAYSIVGASLEGGTMYFTLRNPWGIDGVGNDGSNDGYIKLTLAQIQANCSAGSISA
jgi:hypothetical protein